MPQDDVTHAVRAGDGGTGAAASPRMGVNRIVTSNNGNGYTAAPTVAIPNPSCTLNGTTCVDATATATLNTVGGVLIGRLVRSTRGGTVSLLNDVLEAMGKEQPLLGGHGMMWETSGVMAMHPEWVDLPRARLRPARGRAAVAQGLLLVLRQPGPPGLDDGRVRVDGDRVRRHHTRIRGASAPRRAARPRLCEPRMDSRTSTKPLP